MFKFVSLGPHHTGPSPPRPTCSNLLTSWLWSSNCRQAGSRHSIEGCEGYVFTPVFLSTRGCLPQCRLGHHPPGSRHPHPPRKQTPLPPEQTPPKTDHPPEQTATAADGTHPTGMHSCFWSFLCQLYIWDLTYILILHFVNSLWKTFLADVLQVQLQQNKSNFTKIPKLYEIKGTLSHTSSRTRPSLGHHPIHTDRGTGCSDSVDRTPSPGMQA